MITVTITTIAAGYPPLVTGPIQLTQASVNSIISAFSTSFDVASTPADRVVIKVQTSGR